MPLEIRGAHFNSECTISAEDTLRVGPAGPSSSLFPSFPPPSFSLPFLSLPLRIPPFSVSLFPSFPLELGPLNTASGPGGAL